MRNRPKFHHVSRILILSQILAGAACLLGIEKHGIAHQAQAIVVGTFSAGPAFPWFDGWHVGGSITVDEVLLEEPPPRQVTFRFVCEWERGCPWWPSPHYPEFTLRKGLWFLRRIDSKSWESAIGSDSGFRPLSTRAYWENFIRLYKR